MGSKRAFVLVFSTHADELELEALVHCGVVTAHLFVCVFICVGALAREEE